MKKVLIISYYWPPSGGIAVLRCLKLVKYLRNFGWEPVILVPEGADYPGYDDGNFKDIPPNVEIIRCKIWEPYGLYRKITGKKSDAIVNNVFYANEDKRGLMHKLSVWVRSNFFIPDARCFWIKPAVKTALNYISKNQVDAIFSDGPPHTNTRIATILKKVTKIPWLADFQDPWTQVDYYQMLNLTTWGDGKHKKLEQEVFQNADAITIVSKAWKEDLERIGAKNVSVAYWGYDPDDYTNIKVNPDENLFTITHSGILGHDRLPITLFKILSKLITEDKDFKSKLQLQFIGQLDHIVIENLQRYALFENTFITGNVKREKSLEYIKNSNLLLLLLNKQANSKGRVPGKLFEYLACKVPILSIGNTAGDSAEIVTSTNSGKAIEYDDAASLEAEILKYWTSFKLKSNNQEQKNIDDYSVINTVKNISEILHKITN